MRIPVGAEKIPIYIQIEKDDKILTLEEHQKLYSWHDDTTLKYTLEYKEIGSDTRETPVQYTKKHTTANKIYFELPKAASSGVKNYTCAVKFQYGSTVDYLADDFEVTVYDPLE